MPKTWFITGASRGLGAEIAKAALKAGCNVAATARDAQKIKEALGTSDRLLPVTLDVTKDEQIHAAVAAAVKKFGRIDVLVNNAGYGHLGVFEETTLDELRAQYQTNVFGLLAVTKEIVPLMRKQRSGHIFNICSGAGHRGVFGGTAYNPTKFAVEGFSQALAEEMAPFNVTVTSVSPGFFRTDFLDKNSVKYSKRSISDYDKGMNDLKALYESRNHKQLGDPKKLAEVMLKLSEMPKPPVSFFAGSDAVEGLLKGLKHKQEEIEKWRHLSVSTDIPA